MAIFVLLQPGIQPFAHISHRHGLPSRRQLAGNDSEIVRVKYQLDRINGNEFGDDEDIRNETLTTIIDE